MQGSTKPASMRQREKPLRWAGSSKPEESVTRKVQLSKPSYTVATYATKGGGDEGALPKLQNTYKGKEVGKSIFPPGPDLTLINFY